MCIRVKNKLATTSAFKHLKTDLVAEGFDRSLCGGDPLFFNSTKKKKFAPLTAAHFNAIKHGKIQLWGCNTFVSLTLCLDSQPVYSCMHAFVYALHVKGYLTLLHVS